MAGELTGGLFALGGVALAALLGEVRARRESKAQDAAAILAQRRAAYAKALQQVELVASKVAQWIEADPDSEEAAKRAFWDSLTLAYQHKQELRILARTQDPADAMQRILGVYRKAIERNQKELPKPRQERAALVNAFRSDLGLDS